MCDSINDHSLEKKVKLLKYEHIGVQMEWI